MNVILIISTIFLSISILAVLGFSITLVVGIANKKKGAKKAGIIGLIIAGSILAISIVSTAATSILVAQDNPTNIEKSDNSDYSNDDDSDYSDEDDSDEEDTYDPDDYDITDIGEAVEYDSGETVTVNSIKDTSEKLDELDSDQSAVVVNVTVENTTKKAVDFSVNDFTFYDDENDSEELDAKSFEKDIPDKIEPGKKVTLDLYYDVDATGYYAVTYGDNSWEP